MKPIACITGASAGIGRALAHEAAADGYDLLLVARREPALRQVAGECEGSYGVQSEVLPLDLSDPNEWETLIDALDVRAERLEVMINNAGFGSAGRLVDLPWSRQHDMMKVNMNSLAAFSCHSARLMERRGMGFIMNVASTAAFLPGPLMTMYYASKAFVLHFSEGLAREMHGTGVVVSVSCPGPTESEFLDAGGMDKPLFFRGPIPTSQQVAAWSWKQMKRGRMVAVHGWSNRLATLLLRFVPRALMREATYFLNGTKAN